MVEIFLKMLITSNLPVRGNRSDIQFDHQLPKCRVESDVQRSIE